MKMNSYRHVNILVNIEDYTQLKNLSSARSVPISVLVRDGIKHVLKDVKTKDQEVQNAYK